MKSKPGRIALSESFGTVSAARASTGFGPQSFVWRLTTAGSTGIGALRPLLRQAAESFGEERFPYTRIAEVLLDQHLVVLGSVGRPSGQKPGTARRWGQAVWLDWHIRRRLSGICNGEGCAREMLYPESLQFAALMGLPPARLPRTPGEFDAWAEISLQGWPQASYRWMAIDCLTELSPLFWPANLALILYLLPDEFWASFGAELGRDGQRLAELVMGIIKEFSV
jgi:hypothetical protein